MTTPAPQMLCFLQGNQADQVQNLAPANIPTGAHQFCLVGDFYLPDNASFLWQLPYAGGYHSFSWGWDYSGPAGQQAVLSISVTWDGSGSNFMIGSYPFNATPLTAFHLEVRVDTQAGLFDAFVDGVQLTGRYDFFAGSPPFNAKLWTSEVLTYVGHADGCAGNFGFYVGSTTPTGAPHVYLTIPPGGAATDFLTNSTGTAGPFAKSAPHLCSECYDVTTVPPPEIVTLALDDVLVTAQAGSAECTISLEWSDDRGHSFGNPVSQPMGATGDYNRSLVWRRLGYTRDRVFRLTWSCAAPTALQGCWLELTPEKR